MMYNIIVLTVCASCPESLQIMGKRIACQSQVLLQPASAKHRNISFFFSRSPSSVFLCFDDGSFISGIMNYSVNSKQQIKWKFCPVCLGFILSNLIMTLTKLEERMKKNIKNKSFSALMYPCTRFDFIFCCYSLALCPVDQQSITKNRTHICTKQKKCKIMVRVLLPQQGHQSRETQGNSKCITHFIFI